MSWEILTDREAPVPWAQWVDPAAFRAWQWRLLGLLELPVSRWNAPRELVLSDYTRTHLFWRTPVSARAEIQSFRGLVPWESSTADFFAAQWQYLVDVFEAVSWCLRALNQPATACPAYVNAWRACYGSMVEGLPFPTGGIWRREAYTLIDATLPDAARLWENDGPGYGLDIYARLWLTAASAVDDRLLRADAAPPPPRGGGERFCIAADSCGYFRGPDWGGVARDGEATLLVGREETWEFMLRFAWPIAVSRAGDLVAVSRAYVVQRNLVEARTIGGATNADIVRAAARAEEMRATVPQSVEDYRDAMVAIGSALNAVNPVLGAIIAGTGYLAEGIGQLGGWAVARGLDEFGRQRPVLELAQLGGTITRDDQTPPDFVAPPAPPVDPSRYPLTAPRDTAAERRVPDEIAAEDDPAGLSVEDAARAAWEGP